MVVERGNEMTEESAVHHWRALYPIHLTWALATLSGCLNGAAFIYWGPLAFVANLPLLFALRHARSLSHAIALGGWVGFLGGVHIFGVLNYGWWIFWAFSLYTASQMVIFGGVVFYYRSRALPSMGKRLGLLYELWIPCIIWTLTEWLRTVGPLALPASYVGCIADIPWLQPLLGWASIWGGLGVSALIALVPSALFMCLTARDRPTSSSTEEASEAQQSENRIRREQERDEDSHEFEALLSRASRLFIGLSALVLVGVFYLWGALSPLPIEGERIKVAGLQGGFSNDLYEASLADPALSLDILETYEALLLQAREAQAELVIWAENAIRLPIINTSELRERLFPQQSEDPWLIAGVAHMDPDGKQYNLAISANDKRIIGRYAKVKTVPGVEARFTSGEEWKPLPTRWGPMGVLICFESIYPHAGRALTLAGSRLLIVLSNDAGFGETPISHHMTNRAIVRAVESGRWLVRVGQAGVTTIVDPRGETHGRLDLFKAGVLTGEVQLRGEMTYFVRRGLDWLWLFLIILVGPVVQQNYLSIKLKFRRAPGSTLGQTIQFWPLWLGRMSSYLKNRLASKDKHPPPPPEDDPFA